MTDKNNRFLQGIVVAFIFHFLIAILLGLFEFHSNNYSPKILEITLGESGGGGGSGKKSSSGELVILLKHLLSKQIKIIKIL